MIRLMPFLLGSLVFHVGFVVCWTMLGLSEVVNPGTAEHQEDCVFVTLQSVPPETASAPTPASEASAASRASRESAREPEKTAAEEPQQSQDNLSEKLRLRNTARDEAEDAQSATQPTVDDTKSESAPENRAALARNSKSPDYTMEGRTDWDRMYAEYESTVDLTSPPTNKPDTADTQIPPERATELETVPEASESLNRPLGNRSARSEASMPQIASAATQYQAHSGGDLVRFRDEVLEAIRRSIYFPRKAWRKRNHGRATVRFTISRSGELMDVEIVRSSGHSLLDEAALKIMHKAARNFPAIPESCTRKQIQYVVPIVFKKTRN